MEDYLQETAPTPVAGFVYVETGAAPEHTLAEATWAASLAARDPRLMGIVAHAPLEQGDGARSQIDGLVALGPRVKGVRRNLQDEAPDYCLQDGFVRGVKSLSGYPLSFDICVRQPQLAAVTELVRRCPEVPFILDHLGKPDVKSGELEPWRSHLRRLAALPNVACKLSGLTTEAGPHWTPADLTPYLDTLLETFGSERVMFGSDWPVLRLATTYARWWDLCEAYLSDLTPGEQRNVWRKTAQRWYRLDGSTAQLEQG